MISLMGLLSKTNPNKFRKNKQIVNLNKHNLNNCRSRIGRKDQDLEITERKRKSIDLNLKTLIIVNTQRRKKGRDVISINVVSKNNLRDNSMNPKTKNHHISTTKNALKEIETQLTTHLNL